MEPCVSVGTVTRVCTCHGGREQGGSRLGSVLGAGGGLAVTVSPGTHLDAVPALRLQLDICYGEDRRHCKAKKGKSENNKCIGGMMKLKIREIGLCE